MLVTHAALNDKVFDLLRKGLRDFGYDDGRNIKLDIGTASGAMDRLPAIADGFVRAGADIIICPNEPSTRAAMSATKSIPIVMQAKSGGCVSRSLK